MSKVHEAIDEKLRTFIEAQHLFFVATAPSSLDGRLNLSPKGFDSFRILEPRRVAYLDFVGSAAETVAHIRENGRIVFLFCAFSGSPKIVRLHGRGRVIEPQDDAFPELERHFQPAPGVRCIIEAELDRVSDSCGFGVPLFDYRGSRPQLQAWAAKKGEAGLKAYQREKNAESIDGLPTLRWVQTHPSED